MTGQASANHFPGYESDPTAIPFTPDSTVLPITDLPGYVHEPQEYVEPLPPLHPVERFSESTFSGATVGVDPTGEARASEHPDFPAPQLVPVSQPAASPDLPPAEVPAAVGEPAPELPPLPPKPDWYNDLPWDEKSELGSILASMDQLYHNPDEAVLQAEDVVYEVRRFLKENGLAKNDFAQLLESKGWKSETDMAVLAAIPDRRFKIKLPRRSKVKSAEAPVSDSDPYDILPTEIDPDSGKITSRWDFLKVVNKARRDELAHRMGLDKTVRIGNLEVKRGRLIGGILGGIAVGATIMTAISLLKQGDISALDASSGGASGGGLDPTQAQGGGQSSAAPTTTEAIPTTDAAPDTTTSPLPETTTPEASDTAMPTSPIDTTGAQPPDTSAAPTDAPDTPPAGQDTNVAPTPTERVTVEVGDTVYDLGNEHGLTDTQIANGIEDGSIKAYDSAGNQVDVNDIRPGYTVDFNADATPTPPAPTEAPVPPATEIQPEVPAGSEPIQMKGGGTLSDSVHDWMEQHGKTGSIDDATQAVMDYNQSIGIDLDWGTAHDLHSTDIGGQSVATLKGQPIQMPPEAMFDQLMDALETKDEE